MIFSYPWFMGRVWIEKWGMGSEARQMLEQISPPPHTSYVIVSHYLTSLRPHFSIYKRRLRLSLSQDYSKDEMRSCVLYLYSGTWPAVLAIMIIYGQFAFPFLPCMFHTLLYSC